MRTDDIVGSNPNKFAHHHKKYIFENFIKNGVDTIKNSKLLNNGIFTILFLEDESHTFDADRRNANRLGQSVDMRNGEHQHHSSIDNQHEADKRINSRFDIQKRSVQLNVRPKIKLRNEIDNYSSVNHQKHGDHNRAVSQLDTYIKNEPLQAHPEACKDDKSSQLHRLPKVKSIATINYKSPQKAFTNLAALKYGESNNQRQAASKSVEKLNGNRVLNISNDS